MDPRDDLDSLAGRVGCAACGKTVPTDRIRILARRDDLAFVEVACPGCLSDSLGIVVTGADEPAATDDAALRNDGRTAVRYGEFGADDVTRFEHANPIASADVELVRHLLATAGLRALVGRTEPPPSSGTAR